ncbi:MAG: 2-oxoacid:acceptor oxidoreductase family protein [Halanaerobiaceae bacterium]
MSEMLEIRWHGRGGQGAKTASILLAKIAAAGGKHIQAFPEYGPERMGAPVLAYTRISGHKIYKHCQVEYPDLVCVLDSTLIGTIDVTANLKENGKLIINSRKSPTEIREAFGFAEQVKIYTLDADKISEEEIGRVFPNTPLLGAVNVVAELLPEKDFINKAEKQFLHKFSGKQELITGNLDAVKRAMQAVNS